MSPPLLVVSVFFCCRLSAAVTCSPSIFALIHSIVAGVTAVPCCRQGEQPPRRVNTSVKRRLPPSNQQRTTCSVVGACDTATFADAPQPRVAGGNCGLYSRRPRQARLTILQWPALSATRSFSRGPSERSAFPTRQPQRASPPSGPLAVLNAATRRLHPHGKRAGMTMRRLPPFQGGEGVKITDTSLWRHDSRRERRQAAPGQRGIPCVLAEAGCSRRRDILFFVYLCTDNRFVTCILCSSLTTSAFTFSLFLCTIIPCVVLLSLRKKWAAL